MGDRILHVVRHGHYDWENASAGPDGSSLTQRGREQARPTAEALSGVPFAVIRTSTMTRARETTVIVAAAHPDVPVESTDLLRECAPALSLRFALEDPQSVERAQFRRRFLEDPGFRKQVEARYLDRLGISTETLRSGERQAEAAYREFFTGSGNQERHEALVCHGNILRSFVCRALGVPVELFGEMLTSHCGISRFSISPNGDVLLISFNDVGHLPEALRSEL